MKGISIASAKGRRRGFAIVVLLALAAVLVVLAFDLAPFGADRAERGRESGHATEQAATQSQIDGADDARVPAADAAPEPSRTAAEQLAPAPLQGGSRTLRVRVVDDRDRPIQGARVLLGMPRDPNPFVIDDEPTDATGLAAPTLPGNLAHWVAELFVEACVSGASARCDLRGRDLDGEIRIVVRDIGWLEGRIDGEFVGAGLQVVPVREGQDDGVTCSATFDRANVRMAVGLERTFRVTCWLGGDRQVQRAVAGPQRAHEVVPVAFDFRRCRIAFRLPAGDTGKELVAMQVTKSKCTRCDVARGDDGAFTVLVPLATDAWFVLARMAESFETGPRAFAEDVVLGLVRLEPMATAGVVEAHHTDGALSYSQQVPSAFLFPTGERLRASMSTSALFAASPDALGTRLATLRLFDGLAVRPVDYEHYAEPPELVLRGGAIARATLHRGAELDLQAAASGPLSACWIEHATTKERVRSSRAWFEEGRLPAWRFERLPPGDYDLFVEGCTITPSRVTVTAGSKQKVAVDVRQR